MGRGPNVCECDTTCTTGSESAGSGDMARCGYTLVDEDGEEYPCDKPATGWRWYQDVPHEDALEPACWHHQNEGGRRIHAAESAAAGDVGRLSEEWRQFTTAAGFGDGVTEPQATPLHVIDPVLQAFGEAGEHQECPVLCEPCGERLAATPCKSCKGSGCLPNAAMAYLECDHCAGAGKVHAGCAEMSYAELAARDAERAAAVATVERVEVLLDEWPAYTQDGLSEYGRAVAQCRDAIRAALRGTP